MGDGKRRFGWRIGRRGRRLRGLHKSGLYLGQAGSPACGIGLGGAVGIGGIAMGSDDCRTFLSDGVVDQLVRNEARLGWDIFYHLWRSPVDA